jgi:hypothetical protein
MTRVIVDIPQEKMPAFIKLIQTLGLQQHTIRSRGRRSRRQKVTTGLNRLVSPFLLFDWEFYSNELEFE